MSTCTSCGTEVGDHDRFCMSCGHPRSGGHTCHDCGAELAPGARFCTSCGTKVASEIPEGPGYVVDGEWHRAPGEFVRRIPADQMRSAFARMLPGVDLDAFFRGTLVGKLIDTITAKTIRVPAGSVGVVMVDGICQRILPPGEQTTVDWLRSLSGVLSGDVAGAAAAAAERALHGDRLSFYLVDRRPIPVSFTREVATGGGALTTVRARTLISVGSDRDSLGTFLNDVVRERDALSAQDLHGRFRADIEQIVADALAAAGADLPRAQGEANKQLRGRLSGRTGLGFDVSLAPQATVHRLDLRIGDVPTPAASTCSTCEATVQLGSKFCIQCGTEQPPRADTPSDRALFTQDGVQVELDVVLSVQGSDPPTPPADLIRGAAHRYLRDRDWDSVVSTEGFAALEAALRSAAEEALAALGVRLLALDLVDLRSQAGEWALNARADMERARSEALIGREWLEVEQDKLELQQLTLAMALQQQSTQRDHAFAQRSAAIDDARRQADLDEAERELARKQRRAVHTDAMASGAEAHARALAAANQRAELAEQEAGLQASLARQQAVLEADVDKLRREARLAELQGLAALEADVSDREHRQRVEKIEAMSGRSEAEILALQATELATQEHGGAFAEALGKIADASAAARERQRADERLDAKDARVMQLMERMVGAAEEREAATRTAYRDAADGTRQMAQAAVESHAQVAAAKAATIPCPSCGTELPAAARFCGGCGSQLSGEGRV